MFKSKWVARKPRTYIIALKWRTRRHELNKLHLFTKIVSKHVCNEKCKSCECACPTPLSYVITNCKIHACTTRNWNYLATGNGCTQVLTFCQKGGWKIIGPGIFRNNEAPLCDFAFWITKGMSVERILMTSTKLETCTEPDKPQCLYTEC